MLPLLIGDTQKAGEVVGCEVLAADRGFLGHGGRLCFGDLAAHPLGGFHHRPNLILGSAVVPHPRDKPSGSILGIHRPDVSSVQNDFFPALGEKIKIAIAPTPWRWYTFHIPTFDLPRPLWRGIFLLVDRRGVGGYSRRPRRSFPVTAS